WKNLTTAVFKAMNREPNIEFVEMPEYLREKYQYYTQADMRNLSETGIELKSTNLEDAVKDYVQNYLMKEDAHL
ncbi:MAG TPA: ADP-L-glycero-D-mannoheptose-6-epimerase, partial [Candidatus Cloacimonadota bacterium]|nr:ADP-L-glycero-D-mannoheptose-6-epimerase [Candidatus Cloacimonadota bacterium]